MFDVLYDMLVALVALCHLLNKKGSFIFQRSTVLIQRFRLNQPGCWHLVHTIMWSSYINLVLHRNKHFTVTSNKSLQNAIITSCCISSVVDEHCVFSS